MLSQTTTVKFWLKNIIKHIIVTDVGIFAFWRKSSSQMFETVFILWKLMKK